MLGIDISKLTLTCTLVHPVSGKKQWTREFPNTEAGIQRLLAQTPAEVAWVLEPTGRYSDLAVRLGTQAGRTVLQAQPRRAQLFLASLRDGVKTDRVDSHGLALYGLRQPLRPFRLKSEPLQRAEQLLAARKGLSLALSRLRQQAQALPYAADHLQAAIGALEARLEALEDTLTQLLQAHAEFAMFAKLQQTPGIGPVTAATALVCLRDKKFATADQFVAYVGLAVTQHQSGLSAAPGRLRKRGHAELRRLFYLAARANLVCKASPFKLQYQRELAKGLPTTAALCAVARKLARLCWSMCQHNTDYDPGRVHTPPPPTPGKPKIAA